MTKFRKGDICTIEVLVTSSFNDTQVCVRPIDGYADVYLKPHELTMKRPKIEVGDRVVWEVGMGSTYSGEVLSIANDHLWVDRGAGNFSTVWIGNATRVDPDESQPAGADPAPTQPLADGGANIVTKHIGIASPAAMLIDGEDRSGEAAA